MEQHSLVMLVYICVTLNRETTINKCNNFNYNPMHKLAQEHQALQKVYGFPNHLTLMTKENIQISPWWSTYCIPIKMNTTFPRVWSRFVYRSNHLFIFFQEFLKVFVPSAFLLNSRYENKKLDLILDGLNYEYIFLGEKGCLIITYNSTRQEHAWPCKQKPRC